MYEEVPQGYGDIWNGRHGRGGPARAQGRLECDGMDGEVTQGCGDVWRATGCSGRSRKSAGTSGGRRDVRGGPARVRGRLEGDGMFGQVPQGHGDI